MSAVIMYDETVGLTGGKRKLQLCKSFTEIGYCIYQNNCFFAHGMEELVMHQPILRKKMCRNFHQHRFCKFGSRCNFVHDPNYHVQSKKPLSMIRMMEEYPELLTSLSFKKNLLNFI